jgi:pimeloyl-ACP methyl ester carboxylesterase
LFRAILALAAASLISAAHAEPIDQDGWAARKETVKLDNGMKLAVVEYGDPKGKPVILLHGFTDNSRSWTQALPALAEFRVIVPDQRGHGASKAPECCYAVTDFAYDLKLLMDEMKIDRAAIAGHSLGSVVAMEFAGTYPERVEKLVLAGSTGKAPAKRGDWMVEGALAMKDPIDQKGEFISTWFSADGTVKTPVDPNFLAHVFREGRAVPAPVWRSVIGALIDFPVARHASVIKAPVLILAGEKDDLFDAPHLEALRAAFPAAEVIEFKGLGHNFIWEQPETTAPPIAEFLRR